MSLTLNEFAVSVQRLIYQLVRDFELCDRVCLGQHGVTASQGYTLLALPSDGSVSMNALSETMGLANSTMTRMVDQLVSKGLVSRGADREDRRIVRVELTDHGQRVRGTLELAQAGLLQTALSEIPEDERSTVLGALGLLTRSLEKALKTCCGE